jgi:hypothetical protein
MYMKSLLFYGVIAFLAIYSEGYSQLRVGDPGVKVDASKFDSDYPQMERWANAGVRGGIPFIESFDETATMSPGSSADITTAISNLSKRLSNGQKGLLRLESGVYTIDETVKMISNVSIMGESRDDVVCSISMVGGVAFSFYNRQNCGLYNLTIKGSWPEPKYLWNYSLEANEEFENDNISVKFSGGSTDCWLDKVTILNSANDPMRCAADHNTFRDLVVDGCKRKAGGAEGYFFIQGRDNLVTGCQITHLRHISLQGANVEYNVVFDNDFRQEVSFHSGDAGNNLIENNRITLPSDMPPIDPSQGETGPYPETENASPVYFAIMGPWSTQHQLSANPNFIYRNKCVQQNHDFGTSTPWSDDSQVYYGPQHLGLSIEQRISNFPPYSAGAPVAGTLYAIQRSEEVTSMNDGVSNKDIFYPNPFTTSLTVSGVSENLKQVSLIDVMGNRLIQLPVNGGLQSITLSSLESVTAGIYFLKLDYLSRTEVVKVTKVND